MVNGKKCRLPFDICWVGAINISCVTEHRFDFIFRLCRSPLNRMVLFCFRPNTIGKIFKKEGIEGALLCCI